MSSINTDVASLRIDRQQRPAPRRSWPLFVKIGAPTLLVVAAAAAGAKVGLEGSDVRDRVSSLTQGPPRVRVATTRSAAEQRARSAYRQGGYLESERIAVVDPPITGRVLEVLVEEGDEVAGGDVLYRLDDHLVRQRVAVAEARLRQADFEVEQAVKLTNVLGAEERRRRELERERARAEVELAREALEDTVVRAPFDGTVVVENLDEGEVLQPFPHFGIDPRNLLQRSITVADLGRLYAEVDIPEKDFVRVRVGQPATISPDADKERRYEARVFHVTPMADRRQGTFQVRIRVEEPDGFLVPDMAVMVEFLPEEPPEPGQADRVSAPAEAVREGPDGETHVYVVEDGRAVRRRVQVGGAADDDGDWLLVEAGLAAGEEVIVDGDVPDELEFEVEVR